MDYFYPLTTSVKEHAAHEIAQDFWISAEGIDREVLVHEIPRYLGPQALIYPGRNSAGQPGYFITDCWSPLTKEMIRSLKQASAARARKTTSPGRGLEVDGQGQNVREIRQLPKRSNSPAPSKDTATYEETTSRARHQPLRPPLVRRNAIAWPLSGTDVTNILSHEGLRALLSDHPMSDFEDCAPNEIRRARSDSGETYRTSLSTSVNLRTRFSSVCCEGPHSGHTHTVDAFLDTGATDNVISQKLYTILEAMEAVEMKDDGDIFHIRSPIGEVIEVNGSTKVNIRWFDHEGENVRKRIEFKVIPGLYPDMIFKPTTLQELGMLLAADTWPRDDPRKGFLMFNTPWSSSKQKEQNKKQHEIKKAANAARAAQERRDRRDQRLDAAQANGRTESALDSSSEGS